MSVDVAPDTWTHPEMVRALQRIETSLDALRVEVAGKHREFVPREVWEQAWAGLNEWRSAVSTDVVNLEAEAARLRKELDDRLDAERTDRVAGNRWAVGLAITGAGVLTAILNAVGA